MFGYIVLGLVTVVGAWAYGAGKLPIPSFGAKNATPSQPPTPAGAIGTITGPNGQSIPVGPPIPTLPPVPPGTMPAVPPPNVPPPQIDRLLAGFIDTLMLQDPMGPIIEGDLINVDVAKAGFAIPQNVASLGTIYMHVKSLKVPGDTVPPAKILAEFVAPEFMVLGPQQVNRIACTKVVQS